MPSKIKVTGIPTRIRKASLDNKTIYCLDFIAESNANPPKGLPKPTRTPLTVLINEKQWKKFYQKKSNDKIFLLIDGEVTLDVPASVIKGNFGVIAFKIEEIEHKSK